MLLLHLTLLGFTSATAISQKPLSPPPANPSSSPTNTNVQYKNAPQILNTLHSSLRQFPSSFHHNGMSFFPATIPANTLLYHGTHTNETVKGMEWLAFEIEHAEMFARARGPGRGGPGGPGGGPGGKPPPNGPPPGDERPPPFAEEDEGDTSPPYPFHDIEESPYHFNQDDQSNNAKGTSDEEESHGYLHIYQTLHPLTKLLYIDGMSAAKCPLGTLDTTDVILLNNSLSSSTASNQHPENQHEEEKDSEPKKPTHPNSDYARAQGLCTLAEEWGVQGFIRMEAGFELILCNFSSHVKLVSANQRRDPPKSDRERGPPGDVGESEADVVGFEYLRGLEQRYHGITDQRIVVDYSRMVSVFFYPDVNITNPNGERAELPRLTGEESLEFVRVAVGESFKSEGEVDGGLDWQGVADMIISRYTTRLPFLLQLSNSNSSTSVSTALGVIGVLLDVFIDYGNVNLTASVEKCAGQYLLPIITGDRLKTKADHLIYNALLTVTSTICNTLFEVRESLLLASEPSSAAEDSISLDVKVGETIANLIQYLNWATWKECGKCAVDQVCFVAIWPWGDVDDHDHPKCVGPSGMARSRRSYWNTEWGRKN